jgi:hypothetical protein
MSSVSMNSRNLSAPPLVGTGNSLPFSVNDVWVGVRSWLRSMLVMPTMIISGIRPFSARNWTVAEVWPMRRSPSVM